MHRLNQQHISNVLQSIGFRADAGESGFILKQLEFVMAETYSVEYGPNVAALAIPFDNSVPPGAQSFAYDLWDRIGVAKYITAWSDDLPKFEAFVKRTSQECRSFGISYEFTVQDLRAVQFGGGKLNTQRASAARAAVDEFHDSIAWNGDATRNIEGFLDHTAIQSATLANDPWTLSTTGPQLVADLLTIEHSIIQQTRTLIRPDTMCIGMVDNRLLAQPFSSTLAESVLSIFQRSSGIKNVHVVPRLDTAGDDTKSRVIMYRKSPDVVRYVVPIAFEQHAPQAKNLALMTPCEGRSGGLCLVRPMGAIYADTGSVAGT